MIISNPNSRPNLKHAFNPDLSHTEAVASAAVTLIYFVAQVIGLHPDSVAFLLHPSRCSHPRENAPPEFSELPSDRWIDLVVLALAFTLEAWPCSSHERPAQSQGRNLTPRLS